MNIDTLIGAAILAAIQLTGAALYAWGSTRSQARDVWESLAVVNGWWFLVPYAIARDAHHRRQIRRADQLRNQRHEGGR